jgi:hypothetical protein
MKINTILNRLQKECLSKASAAKYVGKENSLSDLKASIARRDAFLEVVEMLKQYKQKD